MNASYWANEKGHGKILSIKGMPPPICSTMKELTESMSLKRMLSAQLKKLLKGATGDKKKKKGSKKKGAGGKKKKKKK